MRTEYLPRTSPGCSRHGLQVWLGAFALGLAHAATWAAPPPPPPIVIEHVTVLSMAPNSSPLQDATVVIQDARIASIGSSTDVVRPKGAKRINARGKWL